jgi:hypothetical protein
MDLARQSAEKAHLPKSNTNGRKAQHALSLTGPKKDPFRGLFYHAC